jgi:hypothetical protein
VWASVQEKERPLRTELLDFAAADTAAADAVPDAAAHGVPDASHTVPNADCGDILANAKPNTRTRNGEPDTRPDPSDGQSHWIPDAGRVQLPADPQAHDRSHAATHAAAHAAADAACDQPLVF